MLRMLVNTIVKPGKRVSPCAREMLLAKYKNAPSHALVSQGSQ